jgi:hypothetical protein
MCTQCTHLDCIVGVEVSDCEVGVHPVNVLLHAPALCTAPIGQYRQYTQPPQAALMDQPVQAFPAGSTRTKKV